MERTESRSTLGTAAREKIISREFWPRAILLDALTKMAGIALTMEAPRKCWFSSWLETPSTTN